MAAAASSLRSLAASQVQAVAFFRLPNSRRDLAPVLKQLAR